MWKYIDDPEISNEFRAMEIPHEYSATSMGMQEQLIGQAEEHGADIIKEPEPARLNSDYLSRGNNSYPGSGSFQGRYNDRVYLGDNSLPGTAVGNPVWDDMHTYGADLSLDDDGNDLEFDNAFQQDLGNHEDYNSPDPPSSFIEDPRTTTMAQVDAKVSIVEFPSNSRTFYVMNCPLCKRFFSTVMGTYTHFRRGGGAHRDLIKSKKNYVEALSVAGWKVTDATQESVDEHNNRVRSNASAQS